jgi:cytochrome c peroxidase
VPRWVARSADGHPKPGESGTLDAMLRELAALAVLNLGCGADPEVEADTYAWQLPPGVPEPHVPADNPMSAAKVELGRHLFYDRRLSVTGEMACATCHRQELAFSDGEVTPIGATGQRVPRNAMSLANVAYYYPYTWSNPVLHGLEEQALVPMFAEAPIELGLTNVIDRILAELAEDPVYAALIPRAFPAKAKAGPLSSADAVAALAAFERSLLSFDSPFDRYLYGHDESAISEEAKWGFELFNSEKFECYHCHSGLNFTSAFRSRDTQSLPRDYQNTGLYNVGGLGMYPSDSPGLVAMTDEPSDSGKFRVPTLRNIAKTAPYMHDGSIETLTEVLDHYAAGGRVIQSGPNAGDGRSNPFKSPFVLGFDPTAEERRALLALLESLTDEGFLADQRFSDPWLQR